MRLVEVDEAVDALALQTIFHEGHVQRLVRVLLTEVRPADPEGTSDTSRPPVLGGGGSYYENVMLKE